MNSANIMKNMKTLKKKNQVKIQWLHIVSKNGNNSWEKNHQLNISSFP